MRLLKYLLVLLLAPSAFSATYWVDEDGKAAWASCTGASPLVGALACSYSTANTNAVYGDLVYMRGGTYTITSNGIFPTNNGITGSPITFQNYNSEEVIISGNSAVTARASIGINLTGKSYIKVNGIKVRNTRLLAKIYTTSHHNEILNCDLGPVRDQWADVEWTGTADNGNGACAAYANSPTVLCDLDVDMSDGTSRRIFNVTDKSTAYNTNSDTATTITHTSYPLEGGTRNYWTAGDQYQVSYNATYYPTAMVIGGGSTHNWIHDNTIHGTGFFLEGDDGLPLFNIGNDTGATADPNNNNTIEDNHIYNGGHHVLGANHGKYNVFRGNYIHNDSWFDDTSYSGNCAALNLCGYRVVSMTTGNTTDGGYGLWEDNRIAWGAQYGGPHLASGSSGSGITVATPGNIMRYNSLFGNALFGMRFGASVAGQSNYNRVYNNTFFHNGYGAADDPAATDNWRNSLTFYSTGTAGVVVKNNLFYETWSATNKNTTTLYYPPIQASAAALADNTITNNYANVTTYDSSATQLAEQSDPLFTNPAIPAEDADKSTVINPFVNAWPNTLPDLSLQTGSPAIDGGTSLTTANGAGVASTTLIVNDSRYFQAGSGATTSPMGSSLSNIQADWICVGTVSNCARITDINYTTHTITLFSALSWSNAAAVWLYKKSDGTQVLYGAAPDYGAFEYGGGVNPTAVVTTPTSANTYDTDQATLALGGTSTPVAPATIASVACVNNRGGTCTASGTTAWTVASCDIAAGVNVVNCTATDSDKLTGSDAITINRYVISSVASGTPGQTTATITWTTNLAANSQVEYGLTNAYGLTTTLDASQVTSHSVGLTGLSPNTEYHYRVVSASFVSADGTFTTAAGDVTPVISSVVATTDLNSVTVTWTTDLAADTHISYGLTAAYGASSTITESVTSHSITVKGLYAGTVYHFVVTSTRLGTTGTTSDATFTTGSSGRIR